MVIAMQIRNLDYTIQCMYIYIYNIVLHEYAQ